MKEPQWYFVESNGEILKATKRKNDFAVRVPTTGLAKGEFTVSFPLRIPNVFNDFFDNYWDAWAESCRRKLEVRLYGHNSSAPDPT